MELGLHDTDASQAHPGQNPGHDYENLGAVLCSLIVLDRQWSTASGLPPNFQLTDFEIPVKTFVCCIIPYFKWTFPYTELIRLRLDS